MSAILEFDEEFDNGRNELKGEDTFEKNDEELEDYVLDDEDSGTSESLTEVLSTDDVTLADEVIYFEEEENNDSVKMYSTKHLVDAYSEYLKALSLLPIGILDSLDIAYKHFVENFNLIPGNILDKLKNELESLSKADNFVLGNEFNNISFDLQDLMNCLEAFYNFSTALSINTLSKVLFSYNEYLTLVKKIDKKVLSNVVDKYKKYKDISSNFSDNIFKSLNIANVNNYFLEICVSKKEEVANINSDNRTDLFDRCYKITNDINCKDPYYVVVPDINEEKFVSILSDTDDRTPDDLCSYYGGLIYNSVLKVKDNLKNENILLENFKYNVENNSVYMTLSMKDRADLSNHLFEQLAKRVSLIKQMEKDLTHGWDKIAGGIGASLDPSMSNVGAYGILDLAIKCAKRYDVNFGGLLSLSSIMNDVNKYGYNVNESYFDK